HSRGARRLDRSGQRSWWRRRFHNLSASGRSNQGRGQGKWRSKGRSDGGDESGNDGDQDHGEGRCMSARILIAEDDADLRDLLQDDLEDAGYETVVAIDGRAAMAHVERVRERIDLLITDMRMPGLAGDELLNAMRTRRSEAPVIVI